MTIILILLFTFLFTSNALANPACAVCTVAVGASLELARYMGVDDSIVGVWAGAMLALIGYWTIIWFDKKGWKFWGRDFILIVSSIAMIGAMYISEMVYTPTILGIFYIDPFLFSTILGAITLIYASAFYQWMKKRNGGHAHFPFEKVFIPVAALGILSVIFYFYPICQKAEDIFAM